MLKRMANEPAVYTDGFMRDTEVVMADRGVAVTRAVNHESNSGTSSTGEVTCRQHRIHDVATDGAGCYQKHHISGMNHVLTPLEDAFDRAEFKGRHA